MTDAELIAATLAGDHRAFQTLIERYEPRVAATVTGMLGHGPDAEDVGQETFIRFYRSLADFRGAANVATYLTRIAMNLSLTELKRRKRRTLLYFFQASSDPDEDGKIEDLLDPGASAEYDDTKDLVHRAIRQLDPKCRAVIVLRLLDGCSTQETADILGIPAGTVMSRLARAQHKLKEILTPYLGAYYEPTSA